MSNDPLHGIILERMLTELVDDYGWDDLASELKKLDKNTPLYRAKHNRIHLLSYSFAPYRIGLNESKSKSKNPRGS